MGYGLIPPEGTRNIPQEGHTYNDGKSSQAEKIWKLGVPTHSGSAGGVSTVACRGVYHLTTEHYSSIHSDKENIRDMCRDGEDAGIISAHVLVLVVGYLHGGIPDNRHRERRGGWGVRVGIIYDKIEY